MTAMNANDAFELIKTALQSKAIQLQGPANSPALPAAEKDAEYLLTLYRQLQGLVQPPTRQ